jgi:hypothetical protein
MSDFAAEEPTPGSIDENIGIVTYIMLSRIYDVLCLIADGVGKGEELMEVVAQHREGKLLGPLPSLMNEEENE